MTKFQSLHKSIEVLKEMQNEINWNYENSNGKEADQEIKAIDHAVESIQKRIAVPRQVDDCGTTYCGSCGDEMSLYGNFCSCCGQYNESLEESDEEDELDENEEEKEDYEDERIMLRQVRAHLSLN